MRESHKRINMHTMELGELFDELTSLRAQVKDLVIEMAQLKIKIEAAEVTEVPEWTEDDYSSIRY